MISVTITNAVTAMNTMRMIAQIQRGNARKKVADLADRGQVEIQHGQRPTKVMVSVPRRVKHPQTTAIKTVLPQHVQRDLEAVHAKYQYQPRVKVQRVQPQAVAVGLNVIKNNL